MKYSGNLFLLSLFLLFSSCGQKQKEEELSSNPIANSTAKDIAEIESFVGRGPGEEVFKANCLTCHSLRYIQMQPEFSRNTWEKIVDKMRKNFGVPIADSTAKVIVDYLMAAKGKDK